MNKNKSNKVGFLDKLGLVLVNFGGAPILNLLTMFFLIFYTDIVGLDPGKVATLILISKILDAVSDPIMGYFMDKARVTKMGKFRPILIFGTLICVINVILVWFGAIWFPVIKYVIVYATYLLLGVTYDTYHIATASMIPVMTADVKERNSLSLWQAVAGMFAIAIWSAIPPMIVANGTLKEYYILIFGSMAFALITVIGGALAIKERVSFKGTDEEKYNFKELLRFLLERPVLVFFIANLLFVIGGNAAAGMNTYFFTYVIGDLAALGTVMLFMMIGLVPSLIFSKAFANKFGKKAAFFVGMVVCAASTLVRLIDVTSVPLIMVSNVILGLGAGLVSPSIFGIMADNTMYLRVKTGKRAEAAIASLSAFIAKVGLGVAGAIPGYILKYSGYVPNSEVQTQRVVDGMVVNVIWLPFLFLAISAVVFWFGYNITKKDADKLAEVVTEQQKALSGESV